jgi:hypothetical protein
MPFQVKWPVTNQVVVSAAGAPAVFIGVPVRTNPRSQFGTRQIVFTVAGAIVREPNLLIAGHQYEVTATGFPETMLYYRRAAPAHGGATNFHFEERTVVMGMAGEISSDPGGRWYRRGNTIVVEGL